MDLKPITPTFSNANEKPKFSGFAIASFVLALLWIGGVGSALAIMFGFVACQQTARGERRGRAIAVAGILLGVLGLALSLLMVLSLFQLVSLI